MVIITNLSTNRETVKCPNVQASECPKQTKHTPQLGIGLELSVCFITIELHGTFSADINKALLCSIATLFL